MNASNPRLTHPGVQRNIPWLCCCSEHLPSPVPLLELGLFFFFNAAQSGRFCPQRAQAAESPRQMLLGAAPRVGGRKPALFRDTARAACPGGRDGWGAS